MRILAFVCLFFSEKYSLKFQSSHKIIINLFVFLHLFLFFYYDVIKDSAYLKFWEILKLFQIQNTLSILKMEKNWKIEFKITFWRTILFKGVGGIGFLLIWGHKIIKVCFLRNQFGHKNVHLNFKKKQSGGRGGYEKKGFGQLLYFWEVGASISTYFEQNCTSFSLDTPAWQLLMTS